MDREESWNKTIKGFAILNDELAAKVPALLNKLYHDYWDEKHKDDAILVCMKCGTWMSGKDVIDKFNKGGYFNEHHCTSDCSGKWELTTHKKNNERKNDETN